MATKLQQAPALAGRLAERFEQGVKKMAELAGTLPESRLEWTPAEGARSYGGVLRHVAFWNRYLAGRLEGGQPDDSANELPAAGCPTRAAAVEALLKTGEEVVAALRARPAAAEQETLELAVPFIEHNAEHYGQLAAYARLMGVVPPASRA